MLLNKAYNPKSLHLLYIIIFFSEVVSGRINAGAIEQFSESVDDISNLRYLAFGTSITWGVGVKNRNNDTYPYLLSSSATNLAIRSSGPNYPSICTQTMVGDEIYDVILLEYFSRAQDGVKQLAERLRQRFPNALIVFLQQWNPKYITYKKDGEKKSMKAWLTEMGLSRNRNGPKLKKAIEATSKADWEFNLKAYKGNMKAFEDAAKTVNGYILKGPPFPIDRFEQSDVKSFMLSTMSMFGPDWFHLSEEGHRSIAQSVKALLHKNSVKRSNEVGTWGQGDLCLHWFETGEVGIPFSNGVRMIEFKQQKHALEFPSTGGSLKISNPFEKPKSLTIFYMTTGPAPSIYPKVEVKINNSQTKSVTVDPVSKGYNFPVHVSDHTVVGMVDPGESIVSIMPLETTEQLFRVVAVALVNGNERFSKNFIGGSSVP